MNYAQNSSETNIAIINELKELGLELKVQEQQSSNEFYRAGLNVAKQLIVNHLKLISSNLIHEAAQRVNKD